MQTLTMFMVLLIRDKLPVGVVEKIVKECEQVKASGQVLTYDSPEVEALAKDYISRLKD